MNEGIVQQFDIPQNLYLEPANLFVAKFMGNPIINNYTIGIRPEYFKLSNNPLINVKTNYVELIGKDCIANFNIDGVDARLITDINSKVSEGDLIGLDIDYSGIYIFDENGDRVY